MGEILRRISRSDFLKLRLRLLHGFGTGSRKARLICGRPFSEIRFEQETQKVYLIDTILRGYPVPELYLQTA